MTTNAHSIHTRQASPTSSGTFFSLFHKHRHSSSLNQSKQGNLFKSSEKSNKNEHTENILNKIRMSSLASVASSMSIPSKRRGDLSGQRSQRRSGRRNDKFLSLWGRRSTTKKVNIFYCDMKIHTINLMIFFFSVEPIIYQIYFILSQQ